MTTVKRACPPEGAALRAFAFTPDTIVVSYRTVHGNVRNFVTAATRILDVSEKALTLKEYMPGTTVVVFVGTPGTRRFLLVMGAQCIQQSCTIIVLEEGGSLLMSEDLYTVVPSADLPVVPPPRRRVPIAGEWKRLVEASAATRGWEIVPYDAAPCDV